MGADEGEESLPLIGVSATGGNVKLCQTFIEMTGNDGWETAASIHSCVDVHVNTNRFETPQDTNRLTHATTGLVLTENFSSVVQHNEFHGLRIGAKIVNLLDEEHPNKVGMHNCLFEECSLAVTVNEDHKSCQSSNEPPDSPKTPQRIKKDTSEIRRECQKHTNLDITIDKCRILNGYYGVMNQSGKTRLLVTKNVFHDICKAVIINYRNKGEATAVQANEFTFSRRLAAVADEAAANPTRENVEGLRYLLYTTYATKSQFSLPYRIAYDKEDFLVITVSGEQEAYVNKKF